MNRDHALKQLLLNVSLWICVGFVIGFGHVFVGNSINSPFPIHELTKLIDIRFFIEVLVAGCLLFFLVSLVSHKSKSAAVKNEGASLSDLVLDEMASVLYNFGSLLLITVYIGASNWFIPVSFCCYLVGVFFKKGDR